MVACVGDIHNAAECMIAGMGGGVGWWSDRDCNIIFFVFDQSCVLHYARILIP